MAAYFSVVFRRQLVGTRKQPPPQTPFTMTLHFQQVIKCK